MRDLKGSIGLICILGIYAMGSSAYAEDQAEKTRRSLAASIYSFFGGNTEKKDVAAEVLLLEKPTKEDAGQYITLSESNRNGTPKKSQKSEKTLAVRQSFEVKPSLMFNMGGMELDGITLGSGPSGFSGSRANTASNRVTFSYSKPGVLPNDRDLGISIGSQFLVEPSTTISPLFEGSQFEHVNARQVYNLSVDMGYAGFQLGASYNQEKKLHSAGLKGFDVGLGYVGEKWGADVKFGEYKREHDRLFATTEEFYNTVYALEFGAAYQIYSNIRFTGRFTYYSYGQEKELEKVRSSQVFFLGTNVNF